MTTSYEFAKTCALDFVKKYAEENEFFTGGSILQAFRETGLPGADLDWRNRWGAIVTLGARKGWYVRSGRAAPTSPQSHTESLTLWRSRRYRGEQSLAPSVSDGDKIKELRRKVLCREVELEDALWSAHSLGWAARGGADVS